MFIETLNPLSQSVSQNNQFLFEFQKRRNTLQVNPGGTAEIGPMGMADNTAMEGAASPTQEVMYLYTPQRLWAILGVRETGDLAMEPHIPS